MRKSISDRLAEICKANGLHYYTGYIDKIGMMGEIHYPCLWVNPPKLVSAHYTDDNAVGQFEARMWLMTNEKVKDERARVAVWDRFERLAYKIIGEAADRYLLFTLTDVSVFEMPLTNRLEFGVQLTVKIDVDECISTAG